MQVIIYKNDDGSVCIINPVKDYLDRYGVEAIALKDVPAGKPYKIIDASELPSREFRNQWDVDEADLTDGFGAESYEFSEVTDESN